MAAFLKTILLAALFLAPQIATLEMPWLTMLEAGWENGRLRREVMRCNRRRLFFLPSLPSPSTSDKARRRLKGRFVGTGPESGRSKENLRDGPAEKVKVKESTGDLGSQYIATMLTCMSCAQNGVDRLFQMTPLNGTLHLLHEDEHLETLAHLVCGRLEDAALAVDTL